MYNYYIRYTVKRFSNSLSIEGSANFNNIEEMLKFADDIKNSVSKIETMNFFITKKENGNVKIIVNW